VAAVPLQIVVPEAVGMAGIGFTITVTAVRGLVQPLTIV
jgi:hypothetical protein